MIYEAGIQTQINTYRRTNPSAKKLTDEQILSILVNNGTIKLTADQKRSLFTNNSKQNDNTGLKLEKTAPKKKTEESIYLQSGRKVVYSRLADGRTVMQYFGADGTPIKPEYFKKVEGQISISADGKSYTITKNGKKQTRKAKNPAQGAIDQNIARLNTQERILKKTKDKQGFIGSSWDWFKNNTGIGDSSDKAQKQIEAERKLLKQIKTGKFSKKDFKEATGLDYTKENLEKFKRGELSKAAEKVNGYKEGQEMAVDVAGDLISGVAAVGIYTAAVAAAPFTGGASIAVGIALATASGATIKVGVKSLDAVTGGREYTLEDLKHDAATGAFSGALAPLTGGLGGAVGKTVATKLGIQAVKQVGKEVAEEVVETGVKQGLKTALTNPAGYEYVGGSLLKRGTAMAAEMATDGALGGAIDGGFRAGLDNNWDAKAMLDGAVEGGIGGAIMSPIIGVGMKASSKSAQKVFGKENVHIDLNGNKAYRISNDRVVVAEKQADGTFNIKDGDYHWNVKNDEQVSFIVNHIDKRKDLSGMTIKERVRENGSKLIKEADPQTGKAVRIINVNSDGSIEFVTVNNYENGVLKKSVEQRSDKIYVTDYASGYKNSIYKDTEIHPNGQKDVTVYKSNGEIDEKYSMPNIELAVDKDGSYVSKENIKILMENFGITDRKEAALLLENVSACGKNDKFLRILTNLNDDNKDIILPLVKDRESAGMAHNFMTKINSANKDVLKYAVKNLNIDKILLFDLAIMTDEVNASRILVALKRGENTNKYSELKRIYKPIMEKMDIANKVEVVQKAIDSWEQDLSKITSDPFKYSDLLGLKLQNSEKYDRILNSGLIEALENGTVKNTSIVPKFANTDLTPEIYSDLKLLKEGKSIVKEFSADTDINKAYNDTSLGDIVEVGNQMYINDGEKLAKWNMTKEMFLKLFPPVDRYAFNQGDVGDCYLLSSISSVMRDKRASVKFYQSFEYDGKDVKVTVKAYEDFKGSQSFKNGELSDTGNNQVDGCKGVQLYERTYEKVALREYKYITKNRRDIIYPNTAENDALIQRIEGGNNAQTISEILGLRIEGEGLRAVRKKVGNKITTEYEGSEMMYYQTSAMPYTMKNSIVQIEIDKLPNKSDIEEVLNNFTQNNPNTTIGLYLNKPESIKTVIDYLANDSDVMLNFGTKHVFAPNAKVDLDSGHAYSIAGYDKTTGIVKMVNPHNNANIREIHIDELSKYVDKVYITNLPHVSRIKIGKASPISENITAISRNKSRNKSYASSSKRIIKTNEKEELVKLLRSIKDDNGKDVFSLELEMVAVSNGKTGELRQLKDAVEKICKKGELSNVERTRIKDALHMILDENSPSVANMKAYSHSLAELYAKKIVPEIRYMVDLILGKDIKITKEIKKGAIFYTAKGEDGIMSARSKSEDSVYSKIRKKVLALKTDIPENLNQADALIGDAGGFRYTINHVDSKNVEKIISDVVPKHDRAEFDKYFVDSYKLTPTQKEKISPKIREYEKRVLERAIHAQSDKFVARLSELIETGEVRIQEFHNYCGHEGIPYFTQEHLQNITWAYGKWFEKMSKDANYTAIKDESGYVVSIKDKFGNKFDRALRIEDSQTNSDVIKESGYTSSQFNIIGENGLKIEFQYRSDEINNFAEYEHVPYDIRENKETVNGPEYNIIRGILKDKTKMSDDDYKKYYNPYLTQVYNYYRRLELGLPVGEKPVLNKDNFKNLTQEEIDLISVDGLKALHDEIEAQRDKK